MFKGSLYLIIMYSSTQLVDKLYSLWCRSPFRVRMIIKEEPVVESLELLTHDESPDLRLWYFLNTVVSKSSSAWPGLRYGTHTICFSSPLILLQFILGCQFCQFSICIYTNQWLWLSADYDHISNSVWGKRRKTGIKNGLLKPFFQNKINSSPFFRLISPTFRTLATWDLKVTWLYSLISYVIKMYTFPSAAP